MFSRAPLKPACFHTTALQVMPSQSAQTWPPHFPFLPSYWRRMLGARGAGDAEAVEPLTTSAGHQPSSPNQPAVDIWRLTKVFPTTGGNEKVAVDALTLGIPQGEITGLLGHNGAGAACSGFLLL